MSTGDKPAKFNPLGARRKPNSIIVGSVVVCVTAALSSVPLSEQLARQSRYQPTNSPNHHSRPGAIDVFLLSSRLLCSMRCCIRVTHLCSHTHTRRDSGAPIEHSQYQFGSRPY